MVNTDKLLDELKKNRDEIKKMIDIIQEHIDEVNKLMKEKKNDFRNSYIFENRLKLITEYMKLVLDMRKEIGKSIKEEIQLREKLENNEANFDDIHALIKALEGRQLEEDENEQETN